MLFMGHQIDSSPCLVLLWGCTRKETWDGNYLELIKYFSSMRGVLKINMNLEQKNCYIFKKLAIAFQLQLKLNVIYFSESKNSNLLLLFLQLFIQVFSKICRN